MWVRYGPMEFAEAILSFLMDPQKAKEMGERGRAYVLAHRSYVRMADVLEERCYNILKIDFPKGGIIRSIGIFVK